MVSICLGEVAIGGRGAEGGAVWSARLLHVRVISATLLQAVGHAANILAISRQPKWPADRMGKGVFELLTQAVDLKGTNVLNALKQPHIDM